ncbi:energy-coupling factor transporter ATPase [Enorma massiliensis]|uniref:ABC transporter ATP-binding protein n=1 Tax=Enorma massiliensis TaxID=1472761 RepID=UPI002E7A7DD4|nr:energy-coupling factor transporter ATPase [Enorma massiliensis]
MEPIIRIDHVSFSYGEASARALDDVTLSVSPGDFLGIIGPSGAGKTTLASAMSGAIPHHYTGPLFGSVLVDGKDTCAVTLTDISQVVGSVLQDIDTQMVASVVEDEMLFGLENFGVPHSQIEERVIDALETVGIADLRERDIATLSGGQKQKVAIAAILALRPRVLVLDEPTAALDPASSRMVFETLRSINRELGVTVVIIEQKVALLSEYASRIAVMQGGRIALEGTPSEVFSHSAELRGIGVDSPRVTRISNSLAARGLIEAGEPCLNVREASLLIQNLCKASSPAPRAAATAGADRTIATAHATAGAARSTIASPGECGMAESPRRPAVKPGASPVVRLRDVTYTYPGGGASVCHLNLEVYPGEFVGLVGQNGAGKTTATKLVNGLLKPSSGTVEVAGLDTRTARTSQIARHAATLFQNPDHQICRDTVLDEVAFGLELGGVDAETAREQARAVAEDFGLPLGEAPFSLSRGQRQMVALASVVVLEPELVILDEPTSGLDYRECMTVMETVRRMADRGSAVIMVCHDMEVVSDFAERLVVMADGEIAAAGPTHDLFADESLMKRASMRPPQVVELANELAHTVSPRFLGLYEVLDVVSCTEELVLHG